MTLHDYSWSYSAYSSALRCLKEFDYTYIQKIPEGATDSDLRFGTALHASLNEELINKNGKELFKVYWESEKEKFQDTGRFNWDQLNDLGNKFLTTFGRKYAKDLIVQEAEVRAYSEYKGIKIEGTADFIGTYQGRPCVLDFKSSAYNYKREKSVVALQLYLYSYLATSKLGFVPETLCYMVFNKGTGTIQVLEWDYKRDKQIEALDNMVKYIQGFQQDKQEFPKNYNSCIIGTRKCKYWSRCHE